MARVHFGRLVGPVGFARTVAIKCLHPGFASDPGIARMFMAEARLTSRMRHLNIVPIVDVLAVEGDLYLVMDYVPGMSLAALIARAIAAGQTIPLPIVLSVMMGVFSGLHAAHEMRDEDGAPLRIVHRDVSPQNILVGDDGVARVLDFGVAKAASAIESTAEGAIKGKIAYMPPEQLAGEDVDQRSDVFAGSVVLWELLALRRLFGRKDAGATALAVTRDTVEPASKYNPSVSPELDAIVLRGLARAPDARWATALDLVRALETVGPSAPTREVGDWVRSLAGSALDDAARLVADIENASVVTETPPRTAAPSSAPSTSPAVSDPAMSSQRTMVSDPAATPEGSGAAQRSRRTRAAVALSAIAALLLGGVLVWRQAHARDGATATDGAPLPVASAASSTTSPSAASSASSLPASSSAASSAVPAASSLDAGTATPAPYASAPSKPRAHAASKAKARSLPTPPCRVLNPDGTFSYRPECLK